MLFCRFATLAPLPNLLSEWCRCGADMKKAWMGSTLMYVPFRLLIEASQMRRYHNKLKVEGAGNTHIRQAELVEEDIVVLVNI